MTEDVSLAEELPSRFVVGMDLGTTNSAVAYVDTAEQPWQVRTFAIPQFVAEGQVEHRETLPSFHFQPIGSSTGAAVRLPWSVADEKQVVGMMARELGALTPGRLISSAKSWLCHAGVDRRAEILPWHAAEDVERFSPVEVSAAYLRHVRASWNAKFPNEPLEKQDFVLTLPASFDEVARELTVAAAADAGLPRVVLIEEPQAAFYAWLYKHTNDWESQVSPGQKILVCDVGGGTSDFTLIRVRRGEQQRIQFHRVAVGEHLILGGDNLDLALAHHLEAKLASGSSGGTSSGSSLTPRQWDVLVRACRRVKEELLGERPVTETTVNLPSAGTKLIGGGVQIPVTRDEVLRVLLDGFFPLVELSEKPIGRRSGFQEFGLPYAADAAITRHLASFLTAHRHAGEEVAAANIGSAAAEPADPADPARPDILLFNGGVFESPVIRERLVQALKHWFATPAEPNWSPQVLANDRLDLAVARGAAYYGMVRRGEGVRIAANLARSYYIGFESEPPAAMCLVPGSAEPGQDIDLTARQFQLLVSQPVEFPLFISSVRLADRPGEIVPIDLEQMKPLPPIRTALRTRRREAADSVPIHLHARLTEIGTLDLWCSEIGGQRSWRLQFDVRSATQTDVAGHQATGEAAGFLDEATWQECQRAIADTFGPAATAAPDSIAKHLVELIGQPRDQWPPSLLRRVWDELFELEAGRRKSATHEARWLNLLGFSLRPGYGMAVDDWRVAETWRMLQGKLVHGSPLCRTESLILWRRVAGGLSSGQQRAIAEPLLVPLRALHRKLTSGKDRGGDTSFSPHEATEVWRLLGSLELLTIAIKTELGRMAIDLAGKKKLDSLRPAMIWTLGRLAAREPVYGPLNAVLAAATCESWLDFLMTHAPPDTTAQFAVVLMSRRTGDRHRDVSAAARERVLGWLDRHFAPPHFQTLVRDGGQLDQEEQSRVFGESLPKGLRIAN